MALNIERGIVPSLMKDFSKAAKTGGQISAAETKKIASKAKNMLKEAYDGVDSSAGLAKDVRALAKTFRAADKDFKMTKASYDVQVAVFGKKLDGKGGDLADITKHIRNTARPSVTPGY